jgi:phage terminase large subunit-like protein
MKFSEEKDRNITRSSVSASSFEKARRRIMKNTKIYVPLEQRTQET